MWSEQTHFKGWGGGMPNTLSTGQRLMAPLLRMDGCSTQDWLFNLENY